MTAYKESLDNPNEGEFWRLRGGAEARNSCYMSKGRFGVCLAREGGLARRIASYLASQNKEGN